MRRADLVRAELLGGIKLFGGMAAVLVVAICFLVGAALLADGLRPAGANTKGPGLTEAEVTEMRKLRTAATAFFNAFDQLGVAVNAAGADSEVRARVNTVWSGLNSAYLTQLNELSYMLGANPFDPVDANYWAYENTVARSQWVTDGLGRLNVLIDNLQSIADAAEAASGDTNYASKPAAYRNAMREHASVSVKAYALSAKATLQSFNQSLGYLGVRDTLWAKPQSLGVSCGSSSFGDSYTDCSYINHRRALGPHGSQQSATHTMNRALTRMQSALDNLRQVYNADALMPASVMDSYQGVILRSMRISHNYFDVLYHMQLIPLTTTQCGMSPFHLLGRSLERITSNVDETSPYSDTPAAHGGPIYGTSNEFVRDLEAWFADFGPELLSRSNAMTAYLNWLNTWSQAWRESSGAAGQVMFFPATFTLHYSIANQTAFPYFTPIRSADELQAWEGGGVLGTPVLRANPTDYTLTGVGNENCGLVNGVLTACGDAIFGTGRPDGEHIYLERIQRVELDRLRSQPNLHNDPNATAVGFCP